MVRCAPGLLLGRRPAATTRPAGCVGAPCCPCLQQRPAGVVREGGRRWEAGGWEDGGHARVGCCASGGHDQVWRIAPSPRGVPASKGWQGGGGKGWAWREPGWRQTSTCEPTEWSRPLLDTSMGGTGSPAPRSTHRSYRRSARPRLHWPLNEQWDGRHARSCRGGGHVIGKNGNLPLADRDERPCSLRPSSKFAPYPWLRRQGRRPGSGSQRASSSLNALRYYEMERKCRRARCDGTA